MRLYRRGLPLQEYREREQVAICETSRHGGGIRGDGSRRSCIAGVEETETVGDEEETLFDAVGAPLVEEPLRPAEPAFGLA